MRFELTVNSAQELERLTSGQMTPAMAAMILREDRIKLRRFSELLRSLYPAGDLQQVLTQGLCAQRPDQNHDTIARNVRNWLADRSYPTDRKTVFAIAFALRLTDTQCSALLGFCTGYGIHYRDGEEAVLAWFLRTGGSWEEAMAFYAQLPTPPQVSESDPVPDSHLSFELKNEFFAAKTTAELRECYLRSLPSFGSLHLRAWKYFKTYMDRLIKPDSAWGMQEETTYSIETIMELYLSMHMPPERRRSQLSVAQKLIRANWPNAAAVRSVLSRKAEVPRKLLLLLYVITENVSAYATEIAQPNRRN